MSGGMDRRTRRSSIGVTVSGLALVAATAATLRAPEPSSPVRPNILLVITDDQPWDTLPTVAGPPAMPWLESRLDDPDDRWMRFTNAFLNVPLCCPSRASILTGRIARRTGVQGNADGTELDESATLATWLDEAGYQTALVGKYLNGYPWDRGPYVPAGWDRFLAKRNLSLATTYEGFPFIDQGVPLTAGTGAGGYATSMLEAEASSFLRGASSRLPWFLVFAPTAPHEPWTPAPEDEGSFDGVTISTPALATLNDVRGKPAWIRALPILDPETARALQERQRRMLETLAAVDRSVRLLVQQVEARGELDRTLIVLITDNGYSFGEHRWIGKRCPYDPCVRTPFVVRSPWTSPRDVATPVSNIDLAPTFLELAGIDPSTVGVDGRSLAPELDDRVPGTVWSEPVVIEWHGDAEVPAWRGLRTEAFSYLEHADGTLELYDLEGRFGPADPLELRNRALDPAYGSILRRLGRALEERAEVPVGA
jgi:arylsulfatase A-like enzyme